MKKLYIFIITLACILLATCGIVFAYFASHDDGEVIATELAIEDDNVVMVSSYNDLIEKGTVSVFNDNEVVSLASTRTILKLANDITLENDIVLTRDIHIDLNQKKLNLNDKTLTLKHDYSGCFMLSNGTIERGEDELGKILLDLPNATLQTNLMSYLANNETTSETSVISAINLNEKYTIYSALYLAANQIATDITKRPEFKTFDEVSSITTFTPSMFINSKTCAYNSNTVEACSFIYKDIDLIDRYLSSDISITYRSSDNSILDNNGKIKGYGDVDLTVTISKERWTTTSVTFPLHVVNLDNTVTKGSVASQVITEYLADYYVGEDLVIKEDVLLSGYYYNINHAIMLPKSIFDGKIEFSYGTSDLLGSENLNARFTLEEDSNAYLFEPTMNDYHLVIKVAGLQNTISKNMHSTYVGLNETVAYYIVNYLYGGSIIYDMASNGKDLVTLSTINSATSSDDLYALKQYISEYNVTGITYSLSGDVNTHYEIVNNKLTLKGTELPSEKESKVTIRINFGTEYTDIDLYVNYLDSNGSTLSSYLTYYSIYNAAVPSELETYFDLPFASNNIAPYTCYDVATYVTEKVESGTDSYTRVTPTLYKPQNLKIALWYDGAEKLVFTSYASTPASFTNQLDAYLTANNITLQQIAAKTGSNAAYYRFSIDAQNSLKVNTKLVIIYNYKFEQSAASWTRYEHTNHDLTDNNTSYLTVLGGLFYNASGTLDYCVKDSNFFIWIYNRFRPNLTGYSDISTATADRIIPIDWLGKSLVITTSDSALSNVNDFNGIKYLSSVTEVDLTNGTLSANVLNGISEMKSLNKLVLKSCGLTDISSLSKLAGQGTLKILDISNNNISYFDGITTITSLEKVYLYGNNATNEYYGSKGICNFQAFADLMRNGTAIYNDISNNVPILYAESNNLDDYRRLKEICYTDKLKDGLDIRNLYDGFVQIGTTVTNVTGRNRPGNNPFGLQTAGTLDWGYQGDETEGAKYILKDVTVNANITGTYYELVNGSYIATTDTKFAANKNYYVLATYLNATYFYVTLTYTSGTELTVKYYVDRY